MKKRGSFNWEKGEDENKEENREQKRKTSTSRLKMEKRGRNEDQRDTISQRIERRD